jgi:hypothetical protein
MAAKLYTDREARLNYRNHEVWRRYFLVKNIILASTFPPSLYITSNFACSKFMKLTKFSRRLLVSTWLNSFCETNFYRFLRAWQVTRLRQSFNMLICALISNVACDGCTKTLKPVMTWPSSVYFDFLL